MPSSFTDALGLEKQATGENDNTWGTLLNTLIDAVDDALGAVQSKAVGGASDITLTSTEALHGTQIYTGVLTGNINVIMPAKHRKWTVFNNTSGAFTLTVKTSAGTGILVPQGLTYDLYGDGTNVVFGTGPNLNGLEFLLDADGDSSFTADTDDRLDLRLQGVDLFRWDGSVASVLNGLDFIASAAGNAVQVQAVGGDTDITLNLVSKGTGTVQVNGSDITTGGLGNIVEDTTPQLGAQLDVNTFGFGDGTLELLTFTETASAINEVNITNAAIGNDPAIGAAGDDTNINLNLTSKGSGVVQANGAEIYRVGGTDVALADGGSGASTAAGARIAFGLVIGSDVLAPDGDGTSLTGIQADLAVPSQAEAESGTVTIERVWTAQRVKQAIAALEAPAASQAEQETGTDITKMVTPGRQHFHASAAKAWLDWSYSAGVPQDDASYNIGALDDDGAGDIGVHFTTAQSGANYAALANGTVGAQDDNTHINTKLTTEVQVLVRNAAGATDTSGSLTVLGDL